MSGLDLGGLVEAGLRVIAPRADGQAIAIGADVTGAVLVGVQQLTAARGRMTAEQITELVRELLDEALDRVPGWAELSEEDRDVVLRAHVILAGLVAKIKPRRVRTTMRRDLWERLQ